jgi:hypothetical protein
MEVKHVRQAGRRRESFEPYIYLRPYGYANISKLNANNADIGVPSSEVPIRSKSGRASLFSPEAVGSTQFEASAQQYRALVLFGAYTGQRSVSTIARLDVEQCREAIETGPPCLLVKASQDKSHIEHCVPLHPAVISSLRPLFDGKRDTEPLFDYNSFQMCG